MGSSGMPNRGKGLFFGIFGGALGVFLMQRYIRDVLPAVFPTPAEATTPNSADPLEARALLAPQYRPGENAYQAVGRVAYTALTGQPPQGVDQRNRLGDLTLWGVGLFLGVVYGATRTTTRPRDLAGGFFYGIRIWLGDELVFPLLGLRAGPTRFSRRQHFALLSAYWVYSFATTNATRLLYWLFSPEHR